MVTNSIYRMKKHDCDGKKTTITTKQLKSECGPC